jgi:hypothetical protein
MYKRPKQEKLPSQLSSFIVERFVYSFDSWINLAYIFGDGNKYTHDIVD